MALCRQFSARLDLDVMRILLVGEKTELFKAVPLPRPGGRSFTSSHCCRAKESVRIVEVGPRDGLQNEKKSIPVATKIELIRRLASTGVQTIEAGSFVHPRWVPQMANSSEILESLLKYPPQANRSITYQWLLPNAKGLTNYFSVLEPHLHLGSKIISSKNGENMANTSSNLAAPPTITTGDDTDPVSSADSAFQHEISIFMSATESFSQKNTNCSIAQSLERFKPMIAEAKAHNSPVRAYISVALGCPFEGPDVPPHKVAELAATLLEMGADEISVADTTGMGTAPRTLQLLRTLTSAGIQSDDLAFHFHDTFGQALVNTVVALEHGIRTFDSAVGGLGGCPFSPGATGNVATEDLIHCIHALGAQTGIDLSRMAAIGEWISTELGRPNESRAGKATLAKIFS